MFAESSPLSEGYGDDDISINLHEESDVMPGLKTHRARMWKEIILCILIVYNTLFAFALWLRFDFINLGSRCEATHDGQHAVPILPKEVNREKIVPVRWANEYSSATAAGMDEVDRNWDNIDASLGLVSISHELATKHGLPPTMNDPNDRGKGVYTLEGCHSLHCLTVIRHTMFQLARGEKLDVPFGHSTHCFGALLQAILCNADTTLLYQKAGSGPGDGQMRKCRNWPAMRDWAKEHSACMKTNSSGIAGQDVEGCDRIRAGDGVLLSDWQAEKKPPAPVKG